MSGMDLVMAGGLVLLVVILACTYLAGRAADREAVMELVEIYELEIAAGAGGSRRPVRP
jgi:hypothetical protein